MKHLVLSITLFLFIGLTWTSTANAAPPDKPDYEKAIDALKEKYRDKYRADNQENPQKVRSQLIKDLRKLRKDYPGEIYPLDMLLGQAARNVSPLSSGSLSPQEQGEHEALLREIAQDARKFIKKNPGDVRPWRILMKAATFSSDANWKRTILEETSVLANPMLKTVADSARYELLALNTLGKPLQIKFEAADGRKVDLQQMKGKVVLVYFCASWCGPCRKEIPGIKATYDKLHKKGFEILGISLDHKEEQFLAYNRKHGISWPQQFNGKGFKNSIVTANAIKWIPVMWLVDKRGHLVDRNARQNLEGKVGKLLAATPAKQ